MLHAIDGFLNEESFKLLQKYCEDNKFEIKKVGEKEFSVLPTPKEMLPLLEIEGKEIVFSFIRSAYRGFNDKLNIHCDYYINNHKVSLASVLYINDEKGVTPNGTAFYSHVLYNDKAPEDLSKIEFDRLILDDSNDLSKWTKTDYIASKPNRLLIYDADYWHAKWPNEIIEGKRIVLIVFYKDIYKLNK